MQTSTGSAYNDPPRFDSLSVGLQGPAPIGQVNDDYTSAAIMVLEDNLDRDDDSGPWVNGTLRIPATQIDQAGTYCKAVSLRERGIRS